MSVLAFVNPNTSFLVHSSGCERTCPPKYHSGRYKAGAKLVRFEPSFGHMVKMTHQQQQAFTVTLFNYDEPLQWHDILLLDKGFERLTNP